MGKKRGSDERAWLTSATRKPSGLHRHERTQSRPRNSLNTNVEENYCGGGMSVRTTMRRVRGNRPRRAMYPRARSRAEKTTSFDTSAHRERDRFAHRIHSVIWL